MTLQRNLSVPQLGLQVCLGGCGAGGTGGTVLGAITRSNRSSTQAPAVSVARTVMATVPTFSLAGVPVR